MRCPNCGTDVGDGVLFCPHCGQNISMKHKRKLRFILMDVQDDRRFRHLASAAVITVVIIAVLSVLFAEWDFGGDGDEKDNPSGPSEYAIILGDGVYIDLYDDFRTGEMSAVVDVSGGIRISLNADAGAGSTSYLWVLRNDSEDVFMFRTKETPEILWTTPSAGIYSVTVKCTGEDGEQTVYQGGIFYHDDLHRSYSFEYSGKVYSVDLTVPIDEYMAAINEGLDRTVDSPEEAASFIRTNGVVADLEAVLRASFLSANPGTSTTGPEYASMILAFVQSCLSEASDTAVHKVSEYWALPVETLFTGCGDDSDLSVVAASLLCAAGYSAGIALIPEHTVAALYLDRYTCSDVPSGYELIRVPLDGRYYYLCECTEAVPIGCLGDGYGYLNGNFYYYGEQVSGDFGIALP